MQSRGARKMNTKTSHGSEESRLDY
jgi:hypothetical protein